MRALHQRVKKPVAFKHGVSYRLCSWPFWVRVGIVSASSLIEACECRWWVDDSCLLFFFFTFSPICSLPWYLCKTRTKTKPAVAVAVHSRVGGSTMIPQELVFSITIIIFQVFIWYGWVFVILCNRGLAMFSGCSIISVFDEAETPPREYYCF